MERLELLRSERSLALLDPRQEASQRHRAMWYFVLEADRFDVAVAAGRATYDDPGATWLER